MKFEFNFTATPPWPLSCGFQLNIERDAVHGSKKQYFQPNLKQGLYFFHTVHD